MSEKLYEDKIEQDLILSIYEKQGNWRLVARCIEICSGLKLSSALWLRVARGDKPFTKETQNAVRACFPGWQNVLLDPVDIVEKYSLHNAIVASDNPDTAVLIDTGGNDVIGITVRMLESDSLHRVKIEIELSLDSGCKEEAIAKICGDPFEIFRLAHTDRRCAYCGAAAPLTIDHVVPKSRGGADSKSNMVWCCFTCNVRKAAHTPEEADMPIIFAEESELE